MSLCSADLILSIFTEIFFCYIKKKKLIVKTVLYPGVVPGSPRPPSLEEFTDQARASSCPLPGESCNQGPPIPATLCANKHGVLPNRKAPPCPGIQDFTTARHTGMADCPHGRPLSPASLKVKLILHVQGL